MRIKALDITCKGYESGNPSSGYDYDCEYENSGEINCDDCICNYGNFNPITGKKVNFILRKIQDRRCRKHYESVYGKIPQIPRLKRKQRILLPLVKLLNHVLRIVNAGLKKKG